MPRRKRRIFTDEEMNKIRRDNRNYRAGERYALKQRKLFFIEYEKLCKKYGCFVQCLYGAHITKQKRGEEIYTIDSHLESLREDLKE